MKKCGVPLILLFLISADAQLAQVFDVQPEQVHIAFGGSYFKLKIFV